MKKNLVAGGANNVKDSIYCIDMGENFLIIDIENLNKKIISKKQIKDKKNILKSFQKKNIDIEKFSPKKYAENINPLIVTGFNCNYCCSYCYQKQKKKKNEILVPGDIGLIKKFYNVYCSQLSIPLNYGEVGIIGGEPLLLENKPTIYRIFEEWSEESFVITTNGTYIENYIEILKDKNIRFRVSLDGSPEAHFKNRKCNEKGVYEKTISGIKLLLENNIETSILTVFNPENIETYPYFFNILEEIGWLKNPKLSVHFIPKIGCGCDDIDREYLMKSLNAFKKLKYLDVRARKVDARKLVPGSISLMLAINLSNRKEYEPYRCGALYSPDFSFLPDGTVHSCLSMPGNTGCIGRYKPNIEIDFKKLEMLRKRRIDRMQKCKRCSVRFLCQGGCIATILDKTGDIEGTYCELWKDTSFLEFFEEIL